MRDRYEGVCYDGPHEGRSHVHHTSCFRVALYKPLSVYAFRIEDVPSPSIDIGWYHWSEPLRKWVFRG